MKGWTISNG